MQHERSPTPDSLSPEGLHRPAHVYRGRHETPAEAASLDWEQSDQIYVGKHRADPEPAYRGRHYAASAEAPSQPSPGIESPIPVPRGPAPEPLIYNQLAREGPPPAPPMTVESPSLLRELPYEMAYDLAVALNNYTRLAAARERSVIGLGAGHGKVEAAREHYEELRLKAKEWFLARVRERNVVFQDWMGLSARDDRAEARAVGAGVRYEAERQSEVGGLLARQRRKFYDWWARQEGGSKFFSRPRLVGTAKKAAVLGAVGIPIGVAAGVAGVFVAGPLVGAVAAGGVARGVARGLLRSQIEKNAGVSVATEQFHQRLTAQYRIIKKEYAGASNPHANYPESVTKVYADATERGVKRNRVRVMGGVAIGAATGFLGAYLGEFVHNAVYGSEYRHGVPPTTTEKPPSSSPTPRAPVSPPEHGLTGQEFIVEPGSGVIREIKEYAAAHNYNITPQDAFRIYTELYQEHGSNIVDLRGPGPDTYLIRPGDIGLSRPGTAQWYPGIEAELRSRLAQAAARAT